MQDRSPPARRIHLQRTAGPYMWVKSVVVTVADHFWCTPINRDCKCPPACLKRADIVAKVFLGWLRKISTAADALYARRRVGPYRFIQDRSRTSVVALKSDAAAERSKDRLSRDF